MKQNDFAIRGYQLETENGFEWVVEYPELPGISGGGDSYEEALKEAEENKRFYFDYLKEENRPIPVPSDQSDLCDLSGKITFRMAKSIHKKAILRAEYEGVSLNQLVNDALISYLATESTKTLILGLVEECIYKKEYKNFRANFEEESNFIIERPKTQKYGWLRTGE